jgi:hypothetical protein
VCGQTTQHRGRAVADRAVPQERIANASKAVPHVPRTRSVTPPPPAPSCVSPRVVSVVAAERRAVQGKRETEQTSARREGGGHCFAGRG